MPSALLVRNFKKLIFYNHKIVYSYFSSHPFPFLKGDPMDTSSIFYLDFLFYIVLQIFVGCGTVHTGRKMANCGSMLVLALTCTGMLLSGASYFLPVPIYPSEVGQSTNCYCLRVYLFCFIIYRHNT